MDNNGCEYCDDLHGNDCLKLTGSEMVEIKPLKFIGFDKIPKRHTEIKNFVFNSLYFYANSKSFKNGEIFIHYSLNREIVRKGFTHDAQGYKLACKEIERIRKEFIIELAEGNYEI